MVEATAATQEQTGPQEGAAEEVPACVMNDEVREYEPSLEDIFVIIKSGDYQRLVFQGQDLREREETHIEDFRKFLEVKGL